VREIYYIGTMHGGFEIETEDDFVIRCSPMEGWMLRKHISVVKEWTKKRNGIVRKLNLVEEINGR